MFTANDIHARLHERPFVPLRIVTSSGQSYDVTHPDLVMVGRRFLFVGVASNDNPSVFETASRISVLHITDLQDMPHPPAAEANGAKS